MMWILYVLGYLIIAIFTGVGIASIFYQIWKREEDVSHIVFESREKEWSSFTEDTHGYLIPVSSIGGMFWPISIPVNILLGITIGVFFIARWCFIHMFSTDRPEKSPKGQKS